MTINFKELIVWQKAMDLTGEIYQIAKRLPKEETYALSDQMRRAAVSILSNIAEGHGRNSTKEFIQFLAIARGSVYELETQLLLCVKIKYMTESEVQNATSLLSEIAKIINSMITKLKGRN